MTRPIGAIALGLTCALIAGAAAWVWIERHRRSRLVLAEVDLVAFMFGLAGLLSLVPETVQAFAPELLGGLNLDAFGLQDVDYAAYVFAPISVGIGLARRMQLVLLERDLARRAP